jgi:hypothetical protein
MGHMVNRGLRSPTTITLDGARGLIKAIEVVFPSSVRIHCWFHRLANIKSQASRGEGPRGHGASLCDQGRSQPQCRESCCRWLFQPLPLSVPCDGCLL